MEIIKIGICQDEDGFAQALAKGLSRESRAIIFRILRSVEEGEDCQLILSFEKVRDQRLVYLSEDSNANSQIEEPPYQIFRYEDCQTMVKHLLFIYFSMTGKVINYGTGRTCKILISMAECGGAGATSLAISLGRTLFALYGYKCLYLNLCPINDGNKYFANPQFNPMIKLLYYLDADKPFPFESFISSADELDYINTDILNQHLHDLSPEIMEKLFWRIEQLGLYQYVIVDVGNHLTRENLKLMEDAEYTLYLRHRKRKQSRDLRERLLADVKKRTIAGKVIVVENFASDQWENEGSEDFHIEEKSETFYADDDDVLQIKLNHDYGISVAAIAKRVVEEVDESGQPQRDL